MLGDILGAFASGGASVIFGGITGLLGTAVTKWSEYKARQQDLEALRIKNDHELKVKDKDAEIMRQEWEGRNQVAMTEAAGREAEADADAFAQSFKMEPKMYNKAGDRPWLIRFILGLLDFIRGAMRPFLTIYLCVLTTKIYWDLNGLLGSAINPDAIIAHMVHTFLYLFTTCALWWFGTRNKQQPPKVIR